MSRRIITTLFLLALLAPSDGWAKKQKTGVLEKDLFTDSLNGYQFSVPHNWKLKTENEPSLSRATLQKIKLEKLPAGGSQGYYDGERYIPTIYVLVDTTSLSLERFCELLLKAKGHLPQEEYYLMKLDLLMQSELESQLKVKVAGQEGVSYTFQKKYLKTVQDPRQRTYGTSAQITVEESLLGRLVLFKKGNKIFMIQCAGERTTFQFEETDYQKFFESWKFKG